MTSRFTLRNRDPGRLEDRACRTRDGPPVQAFQNCDPGPWPVRPRPRSCRRLRRRLLLRNWWRRRCAHANCCRGVSATRSQQPRAGAGRDRDDRPGLYRLLESEWLRGVTGPRSLAEAGRRGHDQWLGRGTLWEWRPRSWRPRPGFHSAIISVEPSTLPGCHSARTVDYSITSSAEPI